MVRDNSEAKEVAEDHSKAELRFLVRDFSKAEEVAKVHCKVDVMGIDNSKVEEVEELEKDHSTAKS